MRREVAPPYKGVEEAIDYALRAEGRPYVLADPADNAGGGSPSDNTTILRALIAKGVEGAALGPIWDPMVVKFAFAVGEGAKLKMRIGGKVGAASGQPVDAEVEVIKLAPNARQRFAEGSVPLGDAAGLRIGGVEVVVNSWRTQARSPDLFDVVGIPSRERKILVVKSTNHFHAAFAPIAKEIVYVESDGPLPRTYQKVPYTKIDRPLWPMVEDPLSLDRK
jgi:microcystin degradation protein MlrC